MLGGIARQGDAAALPPARRPRRDAARVRCTAEAASRRSLRNADREDSRRRRGTWYCEHQLLLGSLGATCRRPDLSRHSSCTRRSARRRSESARTVQPPVRSNSVCEAGSSSGDLLRTQAARSGAFARCAVPAPASRRYESASVSQRRRVSSSVGLSRLTRGEDVQDRGRCSARCDSARRSILHLYTAERAASRA